MIAGCKIRQTSAAANSGEHNSGEHDSGEQYAELVAIARKSSQPVGITNESGEPHIVLEIAGLKISAAPPKKPAVIVAPDDNAPRV